MAQPSFETHLIHPDSTDHPRNDSASIAELPDGTLLLAWMRFNASDHGYQDEGPDEIVSARSSDGGRSWSEPRSLIQTRAGDHNVYTPSLLVLDDASVLLTYHVYHHIEWGKPLDASCYALLSTDDGRSFQPLTTVWEHKSRGEANNTLVRLSTGRLLKCSCEATAWAQPPAGTVTCGCSLSDDNGRSWRDCTTWVGLPLRGAMEAHIAESSDGSLAMTMRTQIGAVFLSRSRDDGDTWSRPQTTTLASPESMPVLAGVPDAHAMVAVWNDAPYDPTIHHYGNRTPLTLAVSHDDGVTFGRHLNIVSDPQRYYTNPSVSFTRSGTTLVTWWTYCDKRTTGISTFEGCGLYLAIADTAQLLRR